MQDLSRRDLLQTTVKLSVAGAAVAGLAGCGVWNRPEAQITSGLVSVGLAADYPSGTVSTAYLTTYGIALANDNGTFLAIHPKCTHLGCMVPWNDKTKQFECPCHGSRYDIRGQVVHGPAQMAMRSVTPKQLANGALAVDLDQLYSH